MVDISAIKTPDNSTYNLKDAQARSDIADLQEAISGIVSFGTCSTAASERIKVVTLSNTNWQLKVGSIIGVKFINTNTYDSTTLAPCLLNVNNTGTKSIYYNTTSTPTGTNNMVFGYKNRITYYMYDGTNWVWLGRSVEQDNTIPASYCITGASTATKVASHSNYVLVSKSYTLITMAYSNTAQSALTLNINSKGAKPIYINGTASSSSNYTLPAGTYIVYYDGTNYHFRTDGRIPSEAGYVLNTNDTVTVANGGTGATTALDAKKCLQAVMIIPAGQTWSQIYSALNALPEGDICMITVPSSSFSVITNNKITNAFRGIFSKTSSTYFDFFGHYGTSGFCTVRLTSPTSSSVGNVTAQKATMTTL